MPRTITQTARKTFVNCLSVFDLKGHELCILEFDEGNNSMFADRIFLKDTGKLLYGQLELDLKTE
jgi:hypothetical protein